MIYVHIQFHNQPKCTNSKYKVIQTPQQAKKKEEPSKDRHYSLNMAKVLRGYLILNSWFAFSCIFKNI